jgi:hypothetical protein
MACSKSSIQLYTNELKNHRDQCLALLQAHEENTPDTFWSRDDQDPVEPEADSDKSLLKLATEVVIQNGKHVFPPPYTRLSDELVYFATKFLKSNVRGRDYPYDFQPRGDIDPDRVPSGVGPIVWAHGLPFFPVYKGYYILCGRKHADWIGWRLHGKHQTTMREYPIWTIGPVVAPGSAISLDRRTERQMLTHKMKSAKECEKGMEKSPVARDVVSNKHFDGSVVPRDSKGGFMITPIYRVQGYSTKVGPNAADGPRAMQMGKLWFTKHRIQDFDWDAVSKVHYTNERNPMIYGDDEPAEAEEEVQDDAEEEVESGIETDFSGFMDETEDNIKTPAEDNMEGVVEDDTDITEPTMNETEVNKSKEVVNMNGEVEGNTEITESVMDEITAEIMHEETAQIKALDITEPKESSPNKIPASQHHGIAKEATETTKSLKIAELIKTTEAQEKDIPQVPETDASGPFTSQCQDDDAVKTTSGHVPQNTEDEAIDQEEDQDTCVLVAEDDGDTGPEPEETKNETDPDAQTSASATDVTDMAAEEGVSETKLTVE